MQKTLNCRWEGLWPGCHLAGLAGRLLAYDGGQTIETAAGRLHPPQLQLLNEQFADYGGNPVNNAFDLVPGENGTICHHGGYLEPGGGFRNPTRAIRPPWTGPTVKQVAAADPARIHVVGI